ncbi:MAG: glutamate--tRNA ligase [Deltaproteobacteria bacterium]|nr:glutamate--tRNA ligase [Deltaproteobacteria bacterium]
MTESDSTLCTRFAPSPTGYLHIGGARTALFNWAYARRFGGKFILRIEDTDRERSTEESERAVIDGMRWLGMDWDGEVVRQSDANARHKEVIEKLLADGKAYRCICSREELEERKQEHIARGDKWTYDRKCREEDFGANCGDHVVRLKLPDTGLLGWDDGVFEESGQDASEIGDVIIRRSDGSPLYHLAVVVDDIDLGINFVIRGQDHHSNTPFQLAIYQALEVDPPRLAHVPLIVGKNGKKLSKRRDPVSLQQFQEDGYLPEAMRNWLIRIGWSHGDQEVFSSEEITQFFDLDHVNRSSAQADLEKLVWLNQHYLKTLPLEKIRDYVLPFLEKELDRAVEWDDALAFYIEADRERPKTLVEMAQRARFLLLEDSELQIDEKAAKKHLKAGIAPALEQLAEAFTALDTWDHDSIEGAFQQVLAAQNKQRSEEQGEMKEMKMGKLAQPTRVAVTGGPVSPGIHETLMALGKESCVARLGKAIQLIRARA